MGGQIVRRRAEPRQERGADVEAVGLRVAGDRLLEEDWALVAVEKFEVTIAFERGPGASSESVPLAGVPCVLVEKPKFAGARRARR